MLDRGSNVIVSTDKLRGRTCRVVCTILPSISHYDFFSLIFDTPWKNIIYGISHVQYFQILLHLYDNALCKPQTATQHRLSTDWKNVCTIETKIDKTNSISKVIWKFTNWVTTFQSIFANVAIVPVYFQRFNAKGIRLMKLALSTRSTRMQLKRHRLSKDTLSLTFYKNRCSSCDQWLSSGRWKIASAVGFPKNIDLQRTDW